MVYFISRSGYCLAACQDLFFIFAIVGLNSALNSLLQIVPSKYYVVLSSVQSSFLTDIYQLQRWRLMGPSVDVWIFLYLYFYLFLFLFFSLQLSPLQYFALWYVATLVSLDSKFTVFSTWNTSRPYVGCFSLSWRLDTLPPDSKLGNHRTHLIFLVLEIFILVTWYPVS